MPLTDRDQSANQFLELIRRSKRGKFKVYIGMSAGVGKTFRMLQEAHALLQNGVDVRVGFVETHGRAETEQLVHGLPVVPRRKLFYKGKELEEMDVQAIVNLHPEIVVVDELAHTNIEGSKNEKRWQDVLELLEAGINVISAVNIQHLESLNADVHHITGIEVRERIPDRILQLADEVVNIDLTADELVARLRAGKIYAPEKVEIALTNFFQPEKILQLRELALREVAHQVERKIEAEVPRSGQLRTERFLACISSNDATAKTVIRKTARLAAYYDAQWMVLYVQTPQEEPDKINLALQRYLINNFKTATELGAEVIRVKSPNIAQTILNVTREREITTVCIGKPHLNLWQIILHTSIFSQLLMHLSGNKVDLIILS
ncbi:MAG TPA: sensor protein KdpD [Saprospiraceae bacterium]|nr:sensor protein KdpD [Saprospiraceae bacterium]HPI06292.1 sensor protein KdpD [Saprospiraceae bacterium]